MFVRIQRLAGFHRDNCYNGETLYFQLMLIMGGLQVFSTKNKFPYAFYFPIVKTYMATKTHYFKRAFFAYGFKDGTTEIAQCLQTEMQGSKSRASKRVNSIGQTACTTFGGKTTCD